MLLNKNEPVRGAKSTILKSEDFTKKKGKFSKALEKKSLKSSQKKSMKGMTTTSGRNRSRMDGKMKLCINAICNQDDNTKLRRSKKSSKKFISQRSILEGKSISGFVSKKGRSARGTSGKLNLNYLRS